MRALRPQLYQSIGAWFEKTLIPPQNDKKDHSKSKKVCVEPAGKKTKNNYYHHFSQSQRPYFKLHRLVVDESHHNKTRDSDRSRIAQRLSVTTKNVWLVLATPVTNNTAGMFVPAVMMGIVTGVTHAPFSRVQPFSANNLPTLHLANASSSQSQPICVLAGIGVVKESLNL
jgi:hypothetical protein